MKIITIFDQNEDFIKLQYESILKHVKGEYEYIVFDNAKTKKQSAKIKECCEDLNIKTVRIKVRYFLSNPSQIAGTALNKAYKYLKNFNEPIFKIDSDMFFISDINLNQLMEKSDLLYVPTYVPKKTMWSGVFGINLQTVKFDLDFRPNVLPKTDTFGQSALLVNDGRYSEKLFELYNLQDVKDGTIETNLNGNCMMKFDEHGLIYKGNDNFPTSDPVNLKNKYDEIIEIMKKHNFPQPYNIDFISIDERNFIVHFKSSNWCPWYTEKYMADKKLAIKNLLDSTK